MSDPQHQPFDGLAALYATGALDRAERTAFETHLEVCLDCVREVKSLLPVAHRLLHTTLPLEPPPALRTRVLREVAGWTPGEDQANGRETAPASARDPSDTADAEPRGTAPERQGPGGLFWLAATLLVGAAGAGGWYVAGLDRELEGLEAALESTTRQNEILELEIALASATAAEREALLAVVTDPNAQQLTLAGQPLAPRASARALWTDSTDLVFLADGLPALPAGDVYQLWFVLPDAPISAALLEPDPEGSVAATLTIPEAVTMPTTMAITIEPEGGVPAPTGDIYLLGQPIG